MSRAEEAQSEYNPVIALTIAGFDPTGGAGLLADVAALSSIGVRAAGAITAMTVQSPVAAATVVPVDTDLLDRTLTRLLSDFSFAAIKIGMLGEGAAAEVVGRHLQSIPRDIPIVCDPVLAAGSGGHLVDEEAKRILIETIIPRATLLTPNVPEAVELSGLPIDDVAQVEAAARKLCEMGAEFVLVKGGHLDGGLQDTLVGPNVVRRWPGKRLIVGQVHGTGCTLSSLIAGYLASKHTMIQAIDNAIDAVHEAIATSWSFSDEGWKFLGPLL